MISSLYASEGVKRRRLDTIVTSRTSGPRNSFMDMGAFSQKPITVPRKSFLPFAEQPNQQTITNQQPAANIVEQTQPAQIATPSQISPQSVSQLVSPPPSDESAVEATPSVYESASSLSSESAASSADSTSSESADEFGFKDSKPKPPPVSVRGLRTDEAINAAAEVVGSVLPVITQGILDSAGAIGELTYKALTSETAAKVGEGAAKAAVQVGKGAANAAVQVGKGAAKAAVQVGKGAANAASEGKDALSGAAQDAAKNTYQTFREGLRNLSNIATDAAESLSESAENRGKPQFLPVSGLPEIPRGPRKNPQRKAKSTGIALNTEVAEMEDKIKPDGSGLSPTESPSDLEIEKLTARIADLQGPSPRTQTGEKYKSESSRKGAETKALKKLNNLLISKGKKNNSQ